MAVVSVRVKNVTGKATGRSVFDAKREYAATYIVTTDSSNEDPVGILNYFQTTPTLPWIGTTFSYLNNFQTQVVCTDVSVGEREKGSSNVWLTTATFSPVKSDDDDENDKPNGEKSKDPLDWHDEIDVSYHPITVPVTKAIYRGASNGAVSFYLKEGSEGPVRDSAGVAFDPPYETELYIKVLRITKKVPLIFGNTGIVDDQNTTLENSVNSTQVRINKSDYGAVFYIPPYRGLLMPYQSSFQFANGKKYWNTTVEVHIHPISWRREFLDEGKYRGVEPGEPDGRGGTFSQTEIMAGMGKKLAIKDKLGNWIKSLLNGRGQPLPDTEQPVFLKYSVYPEKDWSEIEW